MNKIIHENFFVAAAEYEKKTGKYVYLFRDEEKDTDQTPIRGAVLDTEVYAARGKRAGHLYFRRGCNHTVYRYYINVDQHNKLRPLTVSMLRAAGVID